MMVVIQTGRTAEPTFARYPECGREMAAVRVGG